MQRDDEWTRAMRKGDFETAWRVSDRVLAWRLARGERCFRAPRHLQFVWRGQPLTGKRVLVRCYHGLGDTLQFVRFAIPLARIARETIFWAQPQLLELLAGVPGVHRVLPLDDGSPPAEYDVDIEIMELPHALRVQPGALAADVPYLGLNLSTPRAAPIAGGRLRAGIACIAGDWDSARSLRPAEAALLTRTDGVEACTLHYPASTEVSADAHLGCADITELARRMRTLDLVISVDTMVAHLAGGMGLRTWTLLPASCDWRWMAGRDDSPWYPQMRLYRQSSAGNWRPVVERVRTDLAALAAQGS